MKFAALLVPVLLVSQTLPAFAQYHYEYGNSRVVNQNQTGLYHPSGTYIGSGTLSQSAQGKTAGVANSLPACNMGSHVRTPGDNMYDNQGTDRAYNGTLVYKDQRQAVVTRQRDRYRALMNQRMAQNAALQRQQQGHLYIPGSNGAVSTYGALPQDQVLYTPSGAATYGGYGGHQGTRNF